MPPKMCEVFFDSTYSQGVSLKWHLCVSFVYFVEARIERNVNGYQGIERTAANKTKNVGMINVHELF